MPWRADDRPGDPGLVTCGRVREWIDPFLDDELARPQEEALEAHLGECPECRSELAMARRLREAMREGLPLLSCPPEVTAEVFRVAREEAGETGAAPRASGRRPSPGLGERLAAWLGGGGMLRPALLTAAVVLLILAAPLLYRSVVPPATDRAGAPTTVADDTLEPPYSAEEVEVAEEQARLVLALVASVGRDAGRAVREEVFDPGIARPTRRIVEGLQAGGLVPAGAGRGTGERNQP